MSDSVWERGGADSISTRKYNFIIGLTLLWGFVMNLLIFNTVPVETLSRIPIWAFLIGYFLTCLAVLAIFTASDNPIISFIGYNLVVVPFGLVLNLIVSRYSPGVVYNAILITAIVTTVMMALATIQPNWFANLGPALCIALVAVIVIELLMIAFTGHSATWIDWIVALIFCGYIGFDWYRANNIPKTVDNAIDSAASLYMDIINLFVRILSISGKRN